MKTTPNGLGMFIWELSRCDGGDLDKIAARCVYSGIGWLALKSGDNGASNGQLTKAFVDRMAIEGLPVFAWWYSAPHSASLEVVHAKRCMDLGVSGIMPDCETWWEARGDAEGKPTIPQDRRAEAATFAANLRAAVGDAFIADCGAWQWPKYHPFFPDVAFGKVFDGRMPERYWTNFPLPQTYAKVVAESEMEWAMLPPEARPLVIPIGAAFDDKQPCTLADFAAFIERYPTCGLWSWQHMNAERWTFLEQRVGPAKIETAPTDPAPPEGPAA